MRATRIKPTNESHTIFSSSRPDTSPNECELQTPRLQRVWHPAAQIQARDVDLQLLRFRLQRFGSPAAQAQGRTILDSSCSHPSSSDVWFQPLRFKPGRFSVPAAQKQAQTNSGLRFDASRSIDTIFLVSESITKIDVVQGLRGKAERAEVRCLSENT